MLYLVETFYSIQGEGRYVGNPSVFFRFGGCNMKCEGFGCSETLGDGTTLLGCDTIYAVNKEHFSHSWIAIEKTQQLLDTLDAHKLPNKPVDIVLTGGEPLIYANEPLFVEFIEHLHSHGHKICFETNGSLRVDFERYPIYKECIFALSVKLASSHEPQKKRINHDALLGFASNAKEAFLKFSIDAQSIDEALEKEIESITAIVPNLQVYCMPVAYDKLELEKNTEALIEFCKENNYTFSDRLHIRVWDSKKGI